MAKTRLQAGGTVDDAPAGLVADKDPSTNTVAAPKRKERYTGAVDCLTQVYKEKGFAGWYQVRFFSFASPGGC